LRAATTAIGLIFLGHRTVQRRHEVQSQIDLLERAFSFSPSKTSLISFLMGTSIR
jgi:hypothetical protein